MQLETPQLHHCREFLAMVRHSRPLHRPWVQPPADAAAYHAYVERLAAGRHVGFFARRADDGSLAGVINLNEMVRGAFQSAYLGYYANAANAGRGLMREALGLVARRAFGPLRLHRLEANIQPANRASIALVRALGFRQEGLSPRYLKIAGRWRDHERWALLRDQRGDSPPRRRT